MSTVRTGLGTVMVAALVALAGCGGASRASFPGAKSGTASEAPPAQDVSVGAEGDGAPAAAAPPAPPGQFQPGASVAPKDGARSAEKKEVAPEPNARPGLGTEWGETRSSRITTVPFVRAEQATPFATASLFYNDETGARAMASAAGFQRTTGGLVSVAGGAVQIGLRDERGKFLNGFIAADRNYAIGEAGNRYTIVIRNRTPVRFECVVSVDGLDVLDGKAASFGKRGYLVDPHGELEIDGFRQSHDAVAAFRFGSVRDSYANQKHGETRNVGVIGLALFHERGSNPFGVSRDEVDKRHDANPFPGQFATPPGR